MKTTFNKYFKKKQRNFNELGKINGERIYDTDEMDEIKELLDV